MVVRRALDGMYFDSVIAHYQACWGAEPTEHRFDQGPVHEQPAGFRVLRFGPTVHRAMWTYATCGMSGVKTPPADKHYAKHHGLELHVLSAQENDSLVELLTIVAWFHTSRELLGHGHTVNFGRPWYPGSECDHGLLSSPYLDGPSLELRRLGSREVEFLWLIPITEKERDFKMAQGLDALEELFERTSFDYLDPFRPSVV